MFKMKTGAMVGKGALVAALLVVGCYQARESEGYHQEHVTRDSGVPCEHEPTPYATEPYCVQAQRAFFDRQRELGCCLPWRCVWHVPATPEDAEREYARAATCADLESARDGVFSSLSAD